MLACSCSYSKLLEEIWEAVGQDMHTYLSALRGMSRVNCIRDLRLGQGPGGVSVFLACEILRGSDA